MKLLLTLPCLFCLALQPAFAAPNALDYIANQALTGISESEKIKIRNLELEMQMAKQKRINSEMAYKVIQLEEAMIDLSKGAQINQPDAPHSMVAKNKTLTGIINQQKQQLVNQRELAADLNAQLEQRATTVKDKRNAQITTQNQQTTERQRYELLNAQFQELQATNAALQESTYQTEQDKHNLIHQNQALIAQARDKDRQVTAAQQRASTRQAQFEVAQDKFKPAVVQQRTNTRQAQFETRQETSGTVWQDYQPQTNNTNSQNSTQFTAKSSPADAASQFKLANDYRANKNYELALYWYLQVAERGYASAQFNVGNMYYNGLGVEKDTTQAFVFYLQSAKQDFVEAQYNVGLMYSSGDGVLKDEAQSFHWYTKAAEQGHQEAQKALSRL